MYQDASHHKSEETLPPRATDHKKRGCLSTLKRLLIIYLVIVLIIDIPNIINHLKWRIRGSADYTFSISKSGLLPKEVIEERIVIVKSNEIIQVIQASTGQSVYSSDVQTIETMFAEAYVCPFFFPLIRCSYKYDPFYGYVSYKKVDCPIPDACYSSATITDLKTNYPP